MDDAEKRAGYELGLAKHKAEQEARRAILDNLGFDWHSSPRVKHDESADSSGRGEYPAYTLSGGRVVKLKQFYQFSLNEGSLCGHAMDPESDFIKAINVAQKNFPRHSKMPVILEPVLHEGSFEPKVIEGNFIGGAPWFNPPPVCTIAYLDSTSTQSWSDGSSVLAIWFQEQYGLPDDARTLEQLTNLDWEKHAHDWEY